MVDNERGTEGGADGFGGSPADEDPVGLLADAEEEDTAAVVERLRESGSRQHVSAESVDDVLAELDGDAGGIDSGGSDRRDAGGEHDSGSEHDSGDGDADHEASGGLVGGGPTTTVSREGIDEVFERLEAETPDHGGAGAFECGASDENSTGEEVDDAVDPSGATSDDAASGTSSTDAGFGTLSGGGPTVTVSDEGVDEVLSRVSDEVDYATFDGDDVPDVAAETEVDPDAVLPDDWGTTEAEEDGDAVPEPDEHTPTEDAADLRPDDADVLDLFADVAEEVNDGGSTAEAPADAPGRADRPDVDLTESAGERFEDEPPVVEPDPIADDFEDDCETDDEVGAPDEGFVADDTETDDELDPSLADEVGALLSAADDVGNRAESEATVDALGDADSRGGTAGASASSERSEPRASDRSSNDPRSRLALNRPNDAGIGWSEDDTGDEQSGLAAEASGLASTASHDGDSATPEADTADEGDDESADDGRGFAGLRHARAAAGWVRSLLARLS